jgi:hypothetical protein
MQLYDDEETLGEMAARIGAAIRFLQHEAKAAGLYGVASALNPAERVATAWPLATEPGATGACRCEEHLHQMLALSGSEAEQTFRLRALAELSAKLNLNELLRLAHLADEDARHVGSLITMLSEDASALPQS